MHGQEYVAQVALYNKAGVQVAAPGQTCERVAASSLATLLAIGWIVPVPTPGDGDIGPASTPADEAGDQVAFGALPTRPGSRRRARDEEGS